MPQLQKSNIIGGGFAGITAALWCRQQDPGREVALFEKGDRLLPWTGRKRLGALVLGEINPKAAPDEGDYPRGWPQILSVLSRWTGQSTHDWLCASGIPVKTTEAGKLTVESPEQLPRRFASILRESGVSLHLNYSVESISGQPDGTFRMWSRDGNAVTSENLLLATGGERNHGMAMAGELGCQMHGVVPAFVRLRLAGTRLTTALGEIERMASLRCPASGFEAAGYLRLSPRGLEGEALSRLSSRSCEEWEKKTYRLKLEVDWIPGESVSSLRGQLDSRCQSGRKKAIGADPLFGFSHRQWNGFLELARVDPETPWIRLKARKLQAFVQLLKAQAVPVSGMGLPAEERAWAGGVGVDAIDWEQCASRRVPGLYFAGEILDYLGSPGGTHLNLTWATAYVAGSAMARPAGGDTR